MLKTSTFKCTYHNIHLGRRLNNMHCIACPIHTRKQEGTFFHPQNTHIVV